MFSKRLSGIFTKKNEDSTESVEAEREKGERESIGANWSIVAGAIGHLGKEALVESLKSRAVQGEEPNLGHVQKLGHLLLEEGYGVSKKHSKNEDSSLFSENGKQKRTQSGKEEFKPHSAQTIYIGCLLMEYAKLRETEANKFTEEENVLLAKAHCEVWRSNSITADPYNLGRSLTIYTEAVKSLSVLGDADTMTDYSKVLQYSGQIEEAKTICMEMLSMYEEREDFPTYLLFAGGMLKACGDFDKAGSYFFEAMNIGPPRLFSRLDMMFIVARTLEESTADSDEPVEDGYKMVHHHLNSDGLIPDTLKYEEWINDANTWLAVADKCSVVGIFSLAADLFGQGINRDLDAFKKPRLWLGFAKSCARCGKNSEAQLALKQALALDPHNVQCKTALEYISDLSQGKFQTLSSGPISNVLELVQEIPARKDLAAAKLQAVMRGKKLRREMSTGHGNILDGGMDLREKLRASLALRLYTHIESIKANILLKLVSDWQYAIKEAKILDVFNGGVFLVKIDNPSLAPCRISGLPNKYALEFTLADQETIKHSTILSEESQSLPNARLLRVAYKEKETGAYYAQLFEIGTVSTGSSDSSEVNEKLQFVLRRKDQSAVLTSDHTYHIARGGMEYEGCYYTYRITNSKDSTVILLYKTNCNQYISFEFKREYFDLTFSIKLVLRTLFAFLRSFNRYSKLLSIAEDNLHNPLPFPSPDKIGPSDDEEEITTVPIIQRTFQEMLDRTENPSGLNVFDANINDRVVSVDPQVIGRGVTFQLKSKDFKTPIFSHSFELQDGTDRKPLPEVLPLENIVVTASATAAPPLSPKVTPPSSRSRSRPQTPQSARQTVVLTRPDSATYQSPSQAAAQQAQEIAEEEMFKNMKAPTRQAGKYEIGAEVVSIKETKKERKSRLTITPGLSTSTGKVAMVGSIPSTPAAQAITQLPSEPSLKPSDTSKDSFLSTLPGGAYKPPSSLLMDIEEGSSVESVSALSKLSEDISLEIEELVLETKDEEKKQEELVVKKGEEYKKNEDQEIKESVKPKKKKAPEKPAGPPPAAAALFLSAGSSSPPMKKDDKKGKGKSKKTSAATKKEVPGGSFGSAVSVVNDSATNVGGTDSISALETPTLDDSNSFVSSLESSTNMDKDTILSPATMLASSADSGGVMVPSLELTTKIVDDLKKNSAPPKEEEENRLLEEVEAIEKEEEKVKEEKAKEAKAREEKKASDEALAARLKVDEDAKREEKRLAAIKRKEDTARLKAEKLEADRIAAEKEVKRKEEEEAMEKAKCEMVDRKFQENKRKRAEEIAKKAKEKAEEELLRAQEEKEEDKERTAKIFQEQEQDQEQEQQADNTKSRFGKMPRITVVEKLFPPQLESIHQTESEERDDDVRSTLTFETVEDTYATTDEQGVGFSTTDAKNLVSAFESKQTAQPSTKKELQDMKKLKFGLELQTLFQDETHEEKEAISRSKKQVKEKAQGSALAFVKHQHKMMEAGRWLADFGHAAIFRVNQGLAFDYLSRRLQDARASTAHLSRSLRSSMRQTGQQRRPSVLTKSEVGATGMSSLEAFQKKLHGDMRLSARQSARSARNSQRSSSDQVPNLISIKRSTVIEKRRQSIIQNQLNRQNFIPPSKVLLESTSSKWQQDDSDDDNLRDRRPRNLMLENIGESGDNSPSYSGRLEIISPPKTNPSSPTSPTYIKRKAGAASTKHNVSPHLFPKGHLYPAPPEFKYFRGKTTDTGFFPLTALESAASLVAALKGRTREYYPGVNQSILRGKTPGIDSFESSFLDESTEPAVHVAPINEEVLASIQSNLNKPASKSIVRASIIKANKGFGGISFYKNLESLSLEQLNAQSSIINSKPSTSNANALSAPGTAGLGILGSANLMSSTVISYRKDTHTKASIFNSITSRSLDGLPTQQLNNSIVGRTPFASSAKSLTKTTDNDQQKSRSTGHELFSASMGRYHQLGYTTGDNLYRTHWTNKLHLFYMACTEDRHTLIKRIAALKKSSNETASLTLPEIFCVLAETNGNVGEAVGRLSDAEFIAEVRAICSILSIEDYFISLNISPNHIGSTSPIAAADERNGNSGLGAGNVRSGDDFRISRSNSSILSAVIPSIDELLRFKATKSSGAISSASPMSHMGLTSKSQIVKHRGNKMVLGTRGDVSPSLALTPSNLSIHSAGIRNRAMSPVEVGIDHTDLLSPAVTSEARDMYPLSPMGGGVSASPGPNSPPLLIGEGGFLNSSIEDNAGESVRFNTFMERQIEEQGREGIPTIIMSRRDALRATQDEILGRSGDRGRLARCGLDHGRSYKKMQALKEHTHDWVDYATQRYAETPPFVPGLHSDLQYVDHVIIENAIHEASVYSARSNRSSTSRASRGSRTSFGIDEHRGHHLSGGGRFDSDHAYAPSRTMI